MISAYLIFVVLGLVFFALAAFKTPEPQHLNFFPLGAFFITLAMFFIK